LLCPASLLSCLHHDALHVSRLLYQQLRPLTHGGSSCRPVLACAHPHCMHLTTLSSCTRPLPPAPPLLLRCSPSCSSPACPMSWAHTCWRQARGCRWQGSCAASARPSPACMRPWGLGLETCREAEGMWDALCRCVPCGAVGEREGARAGGWGPGMSKTAGSTAHRRWLQLHLMLRVLSGVWRLPVSISCHAHHMPHPRCNHR
jgi:hypothetical protein